MCWSNMPSPRHSFDARAFSLAFHLLFGAMSTVFISFSLPEPQTTCGGWYDSHWPNHRQMHGYRDGGQGANKNGLSIFLASIHDHSISPQHTKFPPLYWYLESTSFTWDWVCTVTSSGYQQLVIKTVLSKDRCLVLWKFLKPLGYVLLPKHLTTGLFLKS